MRIIIIEQDTVVEEVPNVEILMLARNQLKVIDNGYQELGLPVPEWVTDKQLDIDREITFRVKADLQRRLKTAKARRVALATADDKRKMLDDEIAEIEAKLK